MPPKRKTNPSTATQAQNKRRRQLPPSATYRGRINADANIQPRQTRSRAALPGALPLLTLSDNGVRKAVRAPTEEANPSVEPIPVPSEAPSKTIVTRIKPAEPDELVLDSIERDESPALEDAASSPVSPPFPSPESPSKLPPFEREGAPSPELLLNAFLQQLPSAAPRSPSNHESKDHDWSMFNRELSFEHNPSPRLNVPAIQPCWAGLSNVCGQVCGGKGMDNCQLPPDELVDALSPRSSERNASPRGDGSASHKRKWATASDGSASDFDPYPPSKRQKRSSSEDLGAIPEYHPPNEMGSISFKESNANLWAIPECQPPEEGRHSSFEERRNLDTPQAPSSPPEFSPESYVGRSPSFSPAPASNYSPIPLTGSSPSILGAFSSTHFSEAIMDESHRSTPEVDGSDIEIDCYADYQSSSDDEYPKARVDGESESGRRPWPDSFYHGYSRDSDQGEQGEQDIELGVTPEVELSSPPERSLLSTHNNNSDNETTRHLDYDDDDESSDNTDTPALLHAAPGTCTTTSSDESGAGDWSEYPDADGDATETREVEVEEEEGENDRQREDAAVDAVIEAAAAAAAAEAERERVLDYDADAEETQGSESESEPPLLLNGSVGEDS
ncbi:hypothetical protein C8A00DRAFT_37246 [Chaetomidium leptoderma]|uniref:Uncharacterized protein n=1 Tax=Chaetomidium leptoderma TaxID=669021 RepID=A0AAN6ZVA7_9PEZI|nr:hypothetical protein C8A00DRAFT_37246 [Chaetomidium leptoderma]